MAKAVLTTKIDPTYDDLPEERYHFPRAYLHQAEAAVGDWIVYYEPRRATGNRSSTGGRQVYFATAKISALEADVTRSDHFYAFVKDYLEFDRPVPFKEGNVFYESALRKADGSTNKGAFGRAVRTLPDQEYDRILQAGFARLVGDPTWVLDGVEQSLPYVDVLREGKQDQYEPETQSRRILTRLAKRPFRDRAFSAAIKSAYRDTCAMTGIKILNGGGRSEVQAAHIRPVQHDGPDSVRNGLALCGTMHWMFDRGLVSIDDDYSLLVAGSSVPDTIGRLVNMDRRLLPPARHQDRPHRQFLKYHRETIFKG